MWKIKIRIFTKGVIFKAIQRVQNQLFDCRWFKWSPWKNWLKQGCCWLLFRCGITAFFRRYYQRRRGIILCYHHIRGHLFEQHIRFLKKHYRLVPLSELVSGLDRKNLLPFSLSITFDDGYRELYTELHSVLLRYQVPFTLFLVVNYLKNPLSAWWEDLQRAIEKTTLQKYELNGHIYSLASEHQRRVFYKKLLVNLKQLPEHQKRQVVAKIITDCAQDVDISKAPLFLPLSEASGLLNPRVLLGSHTTSHPILTKIPLAEAEQEIAQSKSWLETTFGRPVEFFSYPNGDAGDFNPRIIQSVQQSGYRAAVTLIQGTNKVGADVFQLKRIIIGEDNSVPVLATKLSGLWGLFYGGYR